MTIKRTYNLFISHSWAHTDAYTKLINLLRGSDDPYFDFRDYSVPKDDPIHNAPNTTMLREAIRRQMQPCSVILVLAGVYSSYSKWINEEIALANSGFQYPKPIIAIEPWGAERTSKIVKDNANYVLKWNAAPIVKMIKQLS